MYIPLKTKSQLPIHIFAKHLVHIKKVVKNWVLLKQVFFTDKQHDPRFPFSDCRFADIKDGNGI